MRANFSHRVKQEICDRQNNICPLCEKPLSGLIEYDHVLPLGLCGNDDAANLQAVHVGCHSEKTREDFQQIRKATSMGGGYGSQYNRRKKRKAAGQKPLLSGQRFSKTLRKKFDGSVIRRNPA